MWVMGGVTFAFTTYLAAGVNLMMTTTGAAALVTTTLLNTPSIRKALGLPEQKVEEPAYKPPRTTKAKGIDGLRERLSENLNEMQKSVSDQLSTMTNRPGSTAEDRAEQARKNQMRKLEEMRRKLERDEFEKKYKR